MYNKFGIHIKVLNFNKSYRFYKNLGFKECFAYGSKEFIKSLNKSIPTAKEKYNGVVFNLGNSLFEIADGHIAVKSKVFKEKIQSSKVSAMIHINSLKRIVNTCKKNKIKIAVPERIFPWGTKEVVIKDPDGFVLVFIEKLKQ
ncbi:VOC family protein [Patescibacteria group bacterium]